MVTKILRRMSGWLPGVTRPPVVSVVRMTGVIATTGRVTPGLSVTTLAPVLERAFSGKAVRAVALLINSPGGSAAQSMLIYRRIRALAVEKGVPVYAFAEDAAASGGYMLACAADEIYANESSIVGSIGVIAATFGVHELLARLGIERRIYTAGAEKSLLDPFKPADPVDVLRLRAVQGDIHESFKELVRLRRGQRLKGDEAELFTGAFWTGRQGLAFGLIDGLSDLRTEMRRRYGNDVVFRVLAPERRLMGRRLRIDGPRPIGACGAGGFLDDALDWLEARAIWARLGL